MYYEWIVKLDWQIKRLRELLTLYNLEKKNDSVHLIYFAAAATAAARCFHLEVQTSLGNMVKKGK